MENPNTSLQSQMRLPQKEAVVIMGGLNDLDGIGNYLNIYGSKLLVDSITTTFNGEHAVVLKREDGRNLYNLFSTISVKTNPFDTYTVKRVRSAKKLGDFLKKGWFAFIFAVIIPLVNGCTVAVVSSVFTDSIGNRFLFAGR